MNTVKTKSFCSFSVDVDLEKKILGDVIFDRVNRQPLQWRDEVVETARYIRASTDKPIYVCMSGGIDSEVVARAFKMADIEFKAICLRHSQNTNEHDLAYAIEWCGRNDVKLNVVPFDVVDFFVREIPKTVESGYDAGGRTFLSYMYIYIMRLVESMGGSAVMGSGETLFKSDRGSVFLEFRPWWYNNIRYIIEQCSNIHFPWFFKTTPEMIGAYLNEELVRLLTVDPSYYACPPLPSVQTLEKTLVYHRHFPDMRRRQKNTGWETLRTNYPVMSVWLDEISARRPTMLDVPRYIPVMTVREQLGLE